MDKFIKIILQVNGFNSFLALKGIRYDDKQEFFHSLEQTADEILHSTEENQIRSDLEVELIAQYQMIGNLRLRPGHRNFIMNLMLEVENTDVNDFFGRCYELPRNTEIVNANPTTPDTSGRLVRRSPNKQVYANQEEHGYSRDDQEEIIVEEEEYLTEDTMDTMHSIIKVEYESTGQDMHFRRKKSSSSKRRQPEHMYNEDFMARTVNPRKRRVALNKTYPNTDEGTKERFIDLIAQVNVYIAFNFHYANFYRSCVLELRVHITGREATPGSKRRNSC